ncbi:MAG: helix-turn-helix domain-containing protein [Planctomycetes bacterium]|nr:helix-turn-helix domain-containing protein [Planctomycetota bacterium]
MGSSESGEKRGTTRKKTNPPRKRKASKASAVRKGARPKATKRKTVKRKGAASSPQKGAKRAWVHLRKEELTAHLAAKGTSASALARALGVSHTAVLSWAKGARIPALETQHALRDFLSRPALAKTKKPKLKPSKGVASDPFKGAALRSWREARGLSRKALAAELGVSASSIQGWESGRTQPRGKSRALLDRSLSAPLPPAPSTTRSSPPSAAPPSSPAPLRLAPPFPALAGSQPGPSLASLREAAIRGASQVVASYVGGGVRIEPNALVTLLRDARQALEGGSLK